MTPLTCREWEHLPVGKGNLTKDDAERLHIHGERAARRLNLQRNAVLSRTSGGLQAGQVVGILVTPSISIEILPKIDSDDGNVRKALVHMLIVALNIRVTNSELASLDTQRNDLLEILIRLFASQLLAAVRRGLPRRYYTQEEELRLLRGKLNTARQFTHLAVRPDRLACRFDELSEDTPLNRVFKSAVSLLAHRARSIDNVRLLTELSARFEFVSTSPNPLQESVRLDRTNTAYHSLYGLARLFLKGEWQSTTSGRTPGFALLFAMNELFEAFIGRSLMRVLTSEYKVHLQHREHYALKDDSSQYIYALRPDVVIEAEKGPIVLDTKWKRLNPGKATLDVETSDVYQMLAYARAYDSARVILLYPMDEERNLQQEIYRKWTVNGIDCSFEIVVVDVGKPDEVDHVLRRIIHSNRVQYETLENWKPKNTPQ